MTGPLTNHIFLVMTHLRPTNDYSYSKRGYWGFRCQKDSKFWRFKSTMTCLANTSQLNNLSFYSNTLKNIESLREKILWKPLQIFNCMLNFRRFAIQRHWKIIFRKCFWWKMKTYQFKMLLWCLCSWCNRISDYTLLPVTWSTKHCAQHFPRIKIKLVQNVVEVNVWNFRSFVFITQERWRWMISCLKFLLQTMFKPVN